ncbi:hypothetical protein LTR95_001641 [Oleoguttula sp. CCFEE 5521]
MFPSRSTLSGLLIVAAYLLSATPAATARTILRQEPKMLSCEAQVELVGEQMLSQCFPRSVEVQYTDEKEVAQIHKCFDRVRENHVYKLCMKGFWCRVQRLPCAEEEW